MNCRPGGLPPSRVFLVLLPEVVVARDLAETLAELTPGARVVVARTVAEAGVALSRIPALTCAFVALGLEQLRASGLESSILALGGRIVLVGAEPGAEIAASGHVALDLPFDASAVGLVLRGIVS